MASTLVSGPETKYLSQKQLLSQSSAGEPTPGHSQKRGIPWLDALLVAGAMSATTIVSSCLLAADRTQWTFPAFLYNIIDENRASVQLVIQVFSNAFALMWIWVLSTMVNHGTRARLCYHAVEVKTLRLWQCLCFRTMDWGLPARSAVVLLLYIVVTAVPSAIWAGALTPIPTTVSSIDIIKIPSWADTSKIREYPSEIDETGPSLRNSRGFFTYSVGVQLQGDLLSSASSATTVDGSVRQHQKIDYTRFGYYGRSYGVGSSVGLTDRDIISHPRTLNYTFMETGFETYVDCARNSSSAFRIQPDGYYYAATGELPNSVTGDPEYSVYVGHDTAAIVAIGVGRNWQAPTRVLAVAAGSQYDHLNKMHCELRFEPRRFNITVDIKSRNITVTPVASPKPINFQPSNLTHVLTRQFELIANTQTNLYVSLLGNSLNASISDFITAQAASGKMMSLVEATPFGLTNAVEAMADDMLTAYAQAQLVVADDTHEIEVGVIRAAMRAGQVSWANRGSAIY